MSTSAQFCTVLTDIMRVRESLSIWRHRNQCGKVMHWISTWVTELPVFALCFLLNVVETSVRWRCWSINRVTAIKSNFYHILETTPVCGECSLSSTAKRTRKGPSTASKHGWCWKWWSINRAAYYRIWTNDVDSHRTTWIQAEDEG